MNPARFDQAGFDQACSDQTGFDRAYFDEDFVARILDDALACEPPGKGPLVYGISGLQGCGKSTLARQMAELASVSDISVAVLSIDDFYLGHDQRITLAHDIHPLLATRGPPGTHDITLACSTLDGLSDGRPTALPRFDKRIDDLLPATSWPTPNHVDLVILEGWFLCVPAQGVDELVVPINELERNDDTDGRWRRHCNDALRDRYPALWQRIDRLLLLQAPRLEIVPEWRWQQEQALHADNPADKVMVADGFRRFMQHYERVSRHALATLPTLADRTTWLDDDRQSLAVEPSQAHPGQ